MASYDTVQEAADRAADVLRQNPNLEAKFYTSAKGIVPVDAGAKKMLDAANSIGNINDGDRDIIIQDVARNPGAGHKTHEQKMDGGTAITIAPK
ncbi:MAG: hypothetical protein JWO78_571 [Micavibrio sp.]|nr:hypothetical protein [Micavibrio sp.]